MKRFTETTKWQDPWFRKLSPHLKCLWNYLCEVCDASGVIDPDWELISFQVGEKCSVDDLRGFGERIKTINNGKLFIPKFIEFQYGQLSRDCKAHNPVFKAIEQHKIESLCIGYAKGIHTLKDKDKDIDKVKDTEEVPEVPFSEQQACGQVGNAGIPSEFAKMVYDDWSARGGKDAGGVQVHFARYCMKRWKREEFQWRQGEHKGKPKTGYKQGAITGTRDLTGLSETAFQSWLQENYPTAIACTLATVPIEQFNEFKTLTK